MYKCWCYRCQYVLFSWLFANKLQLVLRMSCSFSVIVVSFFFCIHLCVFQGKVHLELRLSEVITDSGVISHKLATRWVRSHEPAPPSYISYTLHKTIGVSLSSRMCYPMDGSICSSSESCSGGSFIACFPACLVILFPVSMFFGNKDNKCKKKKEKKKCSYIDLPHTLVLFSFCFNNHWRLFFWNNNNM